MTKLEKAKAAVAQAIARRGALAGSREGREARLRAARSELEAAVRTMQARALIPGGDSRAFDAAASRVEELRSEILAAEGEERDAQEAVRAARQAQEGLLLEMVPPKAHDVKAADEAWIAALEKLGELVGPAVRDVLRAEQARDEKLGELRAMVSDLRGQGPERVQQAGELRGWLRNRPPVSDAAIVGYATLSGLEVTRRIGGVVVGFWRAVGVEPTSGSALDSGPGFDRYAVLHGRALPALDL